MRIPRKARFFFFTLLTQFCSCWKMISFFFFLLFFVVLLRNEIQHFASSNFWQFLDCFVVYFVCSCEALMVEENGQKVLQCQKQSWGLLPVKWCCLWRWVSLFCSLQKFHFLWVVFFNKNWLPTCISFNPMRWCKTIVVEKLREVKKKKLKKSKLIWNSC